MKKRLPVVILLVVILAGLAGIAASACTKKPEYVITGSARSGHAITVSERLAGGTVRTFTLAPGQTLTINRIPGGNARISVDSNGQVVKVRATPFAYVGDGSPCILVQKGVVESISFSKPQNCFSAVTSSPSGGFTITNTGIAGTAYLD
ncbi:hypothetical protein [Desulfofundulus thermocisternus]|uniref:hypothetical protein n=1 Tax=Desulfofundulus thermocisternus TaxID=42471 RepID=UPI000486AC02|nr:hypothetical protein [Desulfofundulus thermocisternus]